MHPGRDGHAAADQRLFRRGGGRGRPRVPLLHRGAGARDRRRSGGTAELRRVPAHPARRRAHGDGRSKEAAGASLDACRREVSRLTYSGIMSLPRILVWSIALVTVLASPALAADPGKSVGTITVDGVATPLTPADASSQERFFDSQKTDTVVTLTDHPLGDLDPRDDIR